MIYLMVNYSVLMVEYGDTRRHVTAYRYLSRSVNVALNVTGRHYNTSFSQYQRAYSFRLIQCGTTIVTHPNGSFKLRNVFVLGYTCVKSIRGPTGMVGSLDWCNCPRARIIRTWEAEWTGTVGSKGARNRDHTYPFTLPFTGVTLRIIKIESLPNLL